MPYNPYTILGIERTASLTQIKQAYRKLALKHHPDVLIAKGFIGSSKYEQIKEAYESLQDPLEKMRIDAALHTAYGYTSRASAPTADTSSTSSTKSNQAEPTGYWQGFYGKHVVKPFLLVLLSALLVYLIYVIRGA